ncbi:MAG TPA: sigma-70 family RNA polymerase sigma factor [Mycobacteriales bacterium]|nr:sigma-70 family RNA polymerase sigma factor [Mycobacteriales bacterium]
MAIRRGREVDEGSFAEVVREHTPLVFGVVLRRVGDRSLAEDLTQETFLHAWRGRASFRGDDEAGAGTSLRGWLCAIAHNVVRDHARAQRRRPVEVPEPGHLDLPDPSDAADGMELDEAMDRLRVALHGLPARHREMFLLRERDGLTYKEIAVAMSCPIGTVMSGLARARERLIAAVGA